MTARRLTPDPLADLDIPNRPRVVASAAAVPARPALVVGEPLPQDEAPPGHRVVGLTPTGELRFAPLPRYTVMRADAAWRNRKRYLGVGVVGAGAAVTTAGLHTLTFCGEVARPRPLLPRAYRTLFWLAGFALLGLGLFAAVMRFGAQALRLGVG